MKTTITVVLIMTCSLLSSGQKLTITENKTLYKITVMEDGERRYYIDTLRSTWKKHKITILSTDGTAKMYQIALGYENGVYFAFNCCDGFLDKYLRSYPRNFLFEEKTEKEAKREEIDGPIRRVEKGHKRGILRLFKKSKSNFF